MYHRIVNYCGGSIYSETVVVMAARCCKYIEGHGNFTDVEIIAGELSPSNATEFGQRSKIKTHLIHPNYTRLPDTNDICLLYLEDAFDLSGPNVKSIPLATKDPEPNTDCNISGWDFGQSTPKILKWTTVATVTDDNCKTPHPDLVPEVMICAGAEVSSY